MQSNRVFDRPIANLSTLQTKSSATPGQAHPAGSNFGVFVPYGPSSVWSESVWLGLVAEARKQNVNVFSFTELNGLKTLSVFIKEHPTLKRQLNAANLHGIVLMNPAEPGLVSKLGLVGTMPVVNVGAVVPGVPSLTTSNYQGMQAALEHLITHHRRQHIAFIRGTAGNEDADERYRAYVETLQAHGLLVDEQLVAQGNFEVRAGRDAIQLLLKQRHAQFDAIVAANDNMALGALDALKEAGRRVPYDVAVIGFDNVGASQVSLPRLTTVQQPLQAMGHRALQMVVALSQGQAVNNEEFSTELVIRQSCGCSSADIVTAAEEAADPRPFPLTSSPTVANNQALILEKLNQSLASAEKLNVPNGWAEQLLAAFFDDVSRKSPGFFLVAIDNLTRLAIEQTAPVSILHAPLSALRCYGRPLFANDPAALARAEALWQQARIFISEGILQQQAIQLSAAQERHTTLGHLSRLMATTFDRDGLLNILASELSQLGLTNCYLVLYEGAERPAEWSRLLLALTDGRRLELEPEGRRFPTIDLLPAKIISANKRNVHIVLALDFNQEQLGYLILDVGVAEGAVYEELSMQLAGALRGALLFHERDLLLEQVAKSARGLDNASAQIAQVAQQSGNITRQVATTITEVAQGANQQAAMLSQASQAVEEMARAIEQANSAAQSGFTLAAEASGTAHSGTQTVAANIKHMTNLKAQFVASSQKVEEVEVRSEKIGAINRTISGIASQTNLLALNAAIEAAHAGDHGRGFAVVADEVRKLAESSAVAAKESAQLIKDIQQSLKEAVKSMRVGTEEMEMSVALANESGQALTKIEHSVTAVNHQIESLVQVSKSLTTSSGVMTGAIENVASVSQQNSAAAQEVSASAAEMQTHMIDVTTSAQSLAEMAHDLSAIVTQFAAAN